LQRQWLVSPETTGWLGGVHAPLRVLQLYVMLSAKMASRRSLASGLYYVTVLREPTRRFLSEFYETFDGWEAKYNTPPRVIWPCSNSLPSELKAIARAGIDNSTKEEYDRLFPYWIGCSRNMAANRQTRALAYIAGNSSHKVRLKLCNEYVQSNRTHRTKCDLQLAKRALRQLTYFGLNEQRCKSEKLFEAIFGLRFTTRHGAARVGTAEGQGSHKAKLKFSELTAEQQRRVQWMNGNDRLLYSEAVQIFNNRLREYSIPEEPQCS